jgi:hypothetical protein
MKEKFQKIESKISSVVQNFSLRDSIIAINIQASVFPQRFDIHTLKSADMKIRLGIDRFSRKLENLHRKLDK